MLEIKNWTVKNFNQENIVIKDFNLSFKENELVAIIGSSGVGKTTLLNSLALNTKILNGELCFN
ncbi:MAG: ATP-binding cassette domain-containing protein, partial [Malacoplasma sp.]|nr:ATP-binding cassette domain-containing protein [Malacoplasma sp.]